MTKKPKLKTVKRWAIESPKYGILPFHSGDTRASVQKFVSCEKGRRVVRVTITWPSL